MTEYEIEMLPLLLMAFFFLGMFIALIRHNDDINKIKNDIRNLYEELWRLKNGRYSDEGATSYSSSPSDSVLQGGKSNIIWSELRGRRSEINASEPERCSEHDSRTRKQDFGIESENERPQ